MALLWGNYHLFGHLGTFQRHSGMAVCNLSSPGPAQRTAGRTGQDWTSGAGSISCVQEQLLSGFSEPKVFRSQWYKPLTVCSHPQPFSPSTLRCHSLQPPIGRLQTRPLGHRGGRRPKKLQSRAFSRPGGHGSQKYLDQLLSLSLALLPTVPFKGLWLL